ncbi:MAG TPA: hypothetical protein GXZ36_05765 [Firmicutes bacterium]|nr:hypothetical protein [Bacillota bacterium]
MKFDMPNCGGCKTCELACSFHHQGDFSFAASSIKIIKKNGEAGYIVELLEEGDAGISCDCCVGEEIPLCLEHCAHSDFLREILEEFFSKRRQIAE